MTVKLICLRARFSLNFSKKNAFEKNSEGYWIHRIVDGANSYFGIVGLTSIQDLIDLNVLPHEATLVKKEKKSFKNIQKQQTFFKPILLAYEPLQELDHLIIFWMRAHPYIAEYRDSKGLIHQLWCINDIRAKQQIQTLFEKVRYAYLADGHHRVAALMQLKSLNPKRYQSILSAYFSFECIRIQPYHRLIRSNISKTRLIVALEEFCHISPRQDSIIPGEGELLMIFKNEYFLLKWKQALLNTEEPLAGAIDVSLFNSFIVQLFGIDDVRNSDDIAYADGSMSIQGHLKQNE